MFTPKYFSVLVNSTGDVNLRVLVTFWAFYYHISNVFSYYCAKILKIFQISKDLLIF